MSFEIHNHSSIFITLETLFIIWIIIHVTGSINRIAKTPFYSTWGRWYGIDVDVSAWVYFVSIISTSWSTCERFQQMREDVAYVASSLIGWNRSHVQVTWERFQPMREDVTSVTSSLIGWNRSHVQVTCERFQAMGEDVTYVKSSVIGWNPSHVTWYDS